jgi:HrpA-like RNA helicase
MSIIPFESTDNLPIHARREDILSSVDNSQITIITAETGAGKSTQVPQYLAEHGYKKIIVTQPRILAARNLCHRVRQEYSWRRGSDSTDLVGYRTAHERDDNPDNTILYCTDGLQLVRELTGSGTSDRQILVLDEIHEWNENMEVLIAWAKKRCLEEPNFKIVLMSATIEAEKLAEYFGTGTPIAVAGRSHPVSKRQGSDVITEIEQVMEKQTSNMLVFLPGKSEIEEVSEAIKVQAARKNIPVLPLHSQLEPDVQQLAFERYPNGKIILSTNVAQTSITIDDIDVAIDSGLERRAEVRDGVEGLFISETSQADCLQRAGRAGRTKAGLYVLAQLGNLSCSPLNERPEYGVPEIMRKHIDRLALRLANIDIDIEDLDFYHSPKRKTIKLAKHTLVSLGALTRQGKVTSIGKRMERFPVESSYARMLVEAETYSDSVQAKLATIIAIQEVGGIVKGGPRFSGWRKFTSEHRSDLLAHFEVFLKLPDIPAEEYEDLGILEKNVTKAEEVNERLNHDLGLGDPVLSVVDESEKPQLLKCIVAGQLHQVWVMQSGAQAMHLRSRKTREISSTTVVKNASLIAGTAFDLQVPTARGLETLKLVNDITAIDPIWLHELNPDAFKVEPGKMYFNEYYGALAVRTRLRFNNKLYEVSSEPVLESSKQNKELFADLYGAWLHSLLEKEREILKLRNHRKILFIPLNKVQGSVRSLADGAISLAELPKSTRIELSKLSKLETYLGEEYIHSLKSPGKKHRHKNGDDTEAWKPRHKRKHKHRKK